MGSVLNPTITKNEEYIRIMNFDFINGIKHLDQGGRRNVLPFATLTKADMAAFSRDALTTASVLLWNFIWGRRVGCPLFGAVHHPIQHKAHENVA
jgi:hypothetical protein